jgi:hypothetical protein
MVPSRAAKAMADVFVDIIPLQKVNHYAPARIPCWRIFPVL